VANVLANAFAVTNVLANVFTIKLVNLMSGYSNRGYPY
jgi:hypothetical protein